MKFMDKFKALYPETGAQEISLEQRLEKLGIDADSRRRIEALPFEVVSLNDDFPYAIEEVIAVSSIVGIDRDDDVSNWVECLGNLHKRRHFDLFVDRSVYEKFLMPPAKSRDDLPEVIELDGKYYISTNGKHRLTFAKCLEIAKVRAVVARKVRQ